MNRKLSFSEKMEAYHLKNNILVIILLVIITVVSILFYMIPSFRANEVLANIALAVFTSLLASIVALTAEVYVAYKDSEKDQFLEDIHTFGIANLNRNKEEALKELLQDCDKEIWISGYRLIMTVNLKEDIANAMSNHGVKVRLLACPPWENAYQLVYGEDKVMDNYFKVFYTLFLAEKDYRKEKNEKLVEIRFVDKPIFSDTYRIDQRLVSGPYMHNRDKYSKKIMAKDFFSYNLVKKSPLYDLVDEEFRTLWDEAYQEVDFDRFEEVYHRYATSDLTEAEKKQLLQEICQSKQ